MFNDTTQAASGPPSALPHNSSQSYASIATGAARIAGGAGAAASGAEPQDVRLEAQQTFPSPGGDYKRDPWQEGQPIVDVQDHLPGAFVSGVHTSPVAPVMQDVAGAPFVNL